MSNPTRQRQKGHGLSSVTVGRTRKVEYPLVFYVEPSDGTPQFRVDLSEFHSGRTSNAANWKGNVSGKPQLIMEILPDLYDSYCKSPASYWSRIRTQIRMLWRCIDHLPEPFAVECIADLTDAHGSIFRQQLGNYYTVVALLLSARERLNLPPLNWPNQLYQEMRVIDDLSERLLRRIYRSLKEEARAIKGVWHLGRSVAALDVPLDDFSTATAIGRLRQSFLRYANPLPRDIINIPNVYRSFLPVPSYLSPGATSVAKPISDINQIHPIFEHPSNRGLAVGPLSEALRWKYPSVWETTTFFLLFLVLTGWNADTALHLDISSDWATPHPLQPDLIVLRSIKNRTKTTQTAICLAKPEFYPYKIICSLIEQTKPLREVIASQIRDIENQIARGDKLSSEELSNLEELRFKEKSPWIYYDRSNCSSVSCLLPWKTLKTPGEALTDLIKRHNIRGEDGELLFIKPSDFRDAWIGFAYDNSGYSWLIAKIAAGHNSLDALRHYFRQRRWRAHSEGRVANLLDKLWSEIRHRRLIDGTVLRFMVEHGEISEEQRRQLENARSRTRMGTGCLDFFNPPPEIAPAHPSGTGCMVQRCVLCSHALIFEESLDGLCRRRAELELLKETTSLTAWMQSSYPDEQEALDQTLQLFDAREVEERSADWRGRLSSGTEYLVQSQGFYGQNSQANN